MNLRIPIPKIAKVSKNPLYVEGPILSEECAEQIARGHAELAA